MTVFLASWRLQGAVALTRINSLETYDDRAKLEAAMAAGKDAVLLSKVGDAAQLFRLD